VGTVSRFAGGTRRARHSVLQLIAKRGRQQRQTESRLDSASLAARHLLARSCRTSPRPTMLRLATAVRRRCVFNATS